MPKKVFRYIVVVLLVIVFGFGFGYLKTFISIKTPPNQEIDPKSFQNIEDRDVSQAEQMKVEPSTMFVYKLYYIKCGHKIEEEKPSQKSYWGLTKDQLENELDDEWFIESFSPEEVVLIKTLDKFCDNHYYVGIQDGYVTLFQGIPGNESLVLQKTDIMADILRYEDRVTLEKGVIIEDKREFLQIKEGLAN